MDTALLVGTFFLALAAAVAAVFAALGRRGGGSGGASADDLDAAVRPLLADMAALKATLDTNRSATAESLRAMRLDAEAAAKVTREELGQVLVKQREELGHVLGQQREELRRTLTQQREQIGVSLDAYQVRVNQSLVQVIESLGTVRTTIADELLKLQQTNQQKLDELRGAVDTKLETTLQTRLDGAFKMMSEQLEKVHKGLGEMQSMAADVGGLKRVLTNVKSRGILGEIQLEAILEQFLTKEQFVRNAETAPGSNKRVEFAVRMPGRDDSGPLLLPIDAKFPKEDYERLLDAQDRADKDAADAAQKALSDAIRTFAKDIRMKYLDPPHTTDFAILFVPTEGLYAELLRSPGLAEELNSTHRVMLAGPTTLSAILQSLQMGFRTLALERRSSEVWQLLGAVKTEFGKFGEVMDTLRKQIDAAANTIEKTGTRTRAIERKLRNVQELPPEEASMLLPPAQGDADERDRVGGDA
ncbi:MAG: DNA recombination protein RmuC [Phycisphaerales bacterium]|nr:DNA recombination protein RmuC [Phycisphaerales bacterium]